MKYYGAPYEGLVGKYDLTKLQAFENPYDALNYANGKWNAVPDNYIPRLLVVIKDDYMHNKNDCMAFFQFTNAEACASFIADEERIIWSCADMDQQRWNGNANMM